MVLPRDRPAFIFCGEKKYGRNREPYIKAIVETAILECGNPAAKPAAKEDLLYMSQYIINESRDLRQQLNPTFSNDVLNLAARGCILAGKPDLGFDLSVFFNRGYVQGYRGSNR